MRKHFSFESSKLALYTKKEILDLTYKNFSPEYAKEVFAYLELHPEIKVLKLPNMKIESESLLLLAANKTLEKIYLPCQIDDSVVIAFAASKTLKNLFISGDAITDISATALAKNTSIKKLYLFGTAISDEGLVSLGKSTTLNYLKIEGNKFRFSSKAFDKLAENKSIDHLYLADLHLNDEHAISLSRMTSLKYSYLNSNEIGDKGVEALSHHPGIVKLALGDNHITDLGLVSISKYSHAKSLDVSNNPVTDDGLAALGKDDWLESLALAGDYFTDKGLIALSKSSHLSKLFIFNPSGKPSSISDVGISAIASKHNLKFIMLRGLNIGTKTILTLSTNPNLQYVDLRETMNQVAPKAVAQLLEIPSLHEVYLTKVQLDRRAAIAVSRHQVLNWLICYDCEISDSDAVILAQNRSLTALTIDGYADHSNNNKIGVNGATALSLNPKIRDLEIDNNNIGDAGAIALAQDKNLKFLSVIHNGLTQYGIDVLLNSGIKHLNVAEH
jgi:Leucine-rich repeat (LRR) protein